MQAPLCNAPAQSVAPSICSSGCPLAHQSPPSASSPGVVLQTRYPFSGPLRSPLAVSLQFRRVSIHPPTAVLWAFGSPRLIPAAPASLSSAKPSATGRFPALPPLFYPPARNSPCHRASLRRNAPALLHRSTHLCGQTLIRPQKCLRDGYSPKPVRTIRGDIYRHAWIYAQHVA